MHSADRARRLGREDLHVRLGTHLRVLVAVGRLDDRSTVVEVERHDAKRLTLVEVDRTGVDRFERARSVDGADQTTVFVGDAVLVRGARREGRCRAPARLARSTPRDGSAARAGLATTS